MLGGFSCQINNRVLAGIIGGLRINLDQLGIVNVQPTARLRGALSSSRGSVAGAMARNHRVGYTHT